MYLSSYWYTRIDAERPKVVKIMRKDSKLIWTCVPY